MRNSSSLDLKNCSLNCFNPQNINVIPNNVLYLNEKAILKAQRVGLDSLLNNYQVKHLGQLNEEQYIDIKNKLGDKKW